jgi:hypothetical protein
MDTGQTNSWIAPGMFERKVLYADIRCREGTMHRMSAFHTFCSEWPYAFVSVSQYASDILVRVADSTELWTKYIFLVFVWRSRVRLRLKDFHSSGYEECRLLAYKIAVRTSQETHYFSATELSQLMLFKIWGFHGADYEESRLLGYKNAVRTSQETHYFSATDLS